MVGELLGARVGEAGALVDAAADAGGALDGPIDGDVRLAGDGELDELMQALTSPMTRSRTRPGTGLGEVTRIGRAPASHV